MGPKVASPLFSATVQGESRVAFQISTTKGTMNPILEKLGEFGLSIQGHGCAFRTGVQGQGMLDLLWSDSDARILTMRSAAR